MLFEGLMRKKRVAGSHSNVHLFYKITWGDPTKLWLVGWHPPGGHPHSACRTGLSVRPYLLRFFALPPQSEPEYRSNHHLLVLHPSRRPDHPEGHVIRPAAPLDKAILQSF